MKYYLKFSSFETSSICLDVTLNSMRIRMSTGYVIRNFSWDDYRQRVNNTETNSYMLNNNLKLIKGRIEAYINEIKINKWIVSKSDFEKKIKMMVNPNYNQLINKKESNNSNDYSKMTFVKAFRIWYKKREKSLQYSKSTIKRYKSFLEVFEDFIYQTNYIPTFDSMDDNFYSEFNYYLLIKRKLLTNSSAVYFKILKTFLRDLEEQGVVINQRFKKFKVQSDRMPPAIALNDADIDAIEKLETNNESLILTRDIFILQIHLLLRISDLHQIKKGNIDLENEIITIFTKKTGEYIKLPIDRKVKEILEKYNYNIPFTSDQVYNRNLKTLAKLAGLTQIIEFNRKSGNTTKKETKEKWEWITSHTARRTGITQLIIKGLSPKMIMQVSGHKQLAAFEKYIKITETEAVDKVRDIWNK